MSLVMVVDDMALVREPIAAALRGAGYATVCAQDGAGAVSIAGQSRPDVIVLDVLMPGMDGMQVLRRLRGRSETAKTPVILLTATSEKPVVMEAARLGVRDYILKTHFSLGELLDRVDKCLTTAAAAA
ncbi:MAG TPA: response regulator [Tepidisphaeraceae bacterium]|jgi:CheY-like chemotaxis protein|nr:response regulator [Tepidisphaeraceae bacterium]